LAYPRPGEEFIVDADASNTGVGVVLSQKQDGEEQVIDYFSKALSKPETNYCVTRKELLAVVKTVEHFHKYLYGQRFKLRTDHASLKWLFQFKNPERQRRQDDLVQRVETTANGLPRGTSCITAGLGPVSS